VRYFPSIVTTTTWESGVNERCSDIEGGAGVQTESFVRIVQ
jgi:hypothetical protein